MYQIKLEQRILKKSYNKGEISPSQNITRKEPDQGRVWPGTRRGSSRSNMCHKTHEKTFYEDDIMPFSLWSLNIIRNHPLPSEFSCFEYGNCGIRITDRVYSYSPSSLIYCEQKIIQVFSVSSQIIINYLRDSVMGIFIVLVPFLQSRHLGPHSYSVAVPNRALNSFHVYSVWQLSGQGVNTFLQARTDWKQQHWAKLKIPQ